MTDMQTFYFFLLATWTVLVASQTDLVADPGLVTLDCDKCTTDRWYFRSDYIWNNTVQVVDAQCEADLELPTDPIPSVTRGLQTNINKYAFPTLPTVTGGAYERSAGVVDMNSACRASLWYPFTLVNDSATVTVSLRVWARNPNIQHNLAADGDAANSGLLQYLTQPNGLLVESRELQEVTNMIRIDIMLPDDSGSFYNRAFSQFPEHIATSIPVLDWEDGFVNPIGGTSGVWAPVEADISEAVATSGTYALRVASANSVIGVSWGITDVHVVTEGGTSEEIEIPTYDVLIDRTQKTVGGTLTFSKTANL